MSPPKRAPTTTPTSSLTWTDARGLVHRGVAQPHTLAAPDRIDLLSPCQGFLRGWAEGVIGPSDAVVTCITCLGDTAWGYTYELMRETCVINARISVQDDGTVLHTLL